jgi:hypothetical protein
MNGRRGRWLASLGGLALAGLSLVGCASSSPSCGSLCGVARPAFESCLEEWGGSWGSAFGYSDASDYDEWCATWVFEQRQLAGAAEDPGAAEAALDDRCIALDLALVEGPCSDYWGLWE